MLRWLIRLAREHLLPAAINLLKHHIVRWIAAALQVRQHLLCLRGNEQMHTAIQSRDIDGWLIVLAAGVIAKWLI